MDCRHRWRYHHSLSRIRCKWCELEAERAEPDPDGRWHDSMPVALRLALRSVKHPSTTQAAPHLA
ncbi:hypothetical protein D3C86_2151510 [compost metagenome]